MMIIDRNEIVGMVNEIDALLEYQASCEKLHEIEELIIKRLVNIDLSIYYQMLWLYNFDVLKVKNMLTKFNLLADTAYDNSEMCVADQYVVMNFLVHFIKRFGNENYLLEKIEKDLEIEKR